MIITGNGDHRGIIRRELEFGKIGIPAALPALGDYTVAKSAVGRNTAANGNLLDAGLLGGLDKLIHQDIDQRLLERSADVLLVILHKRRILGHLVTHEIQQRSLDAAETVVQTGNVRLGELEAQRIPLLGKAVDDRTSGIAEPHHLGTFVESLAHGIVDGLPQDLEIQRGIHLDYLGVAARNQQT